MERDDIVEYSLDAHHNEEQGKKIRKKIIQVTVILTAITIFEVAVGAFVKQSNEYWQIIKWMFIALTLVKAGYIVLVFMHLGDEKKSLKYIILLPYAAFIIYLIYICLVEAMAVDSALKIYMGL